ncbi:MAG: MFS transporter, partial [Ilumatobacteraceae bacterium]
FLYNEGVTRSHPTTEKFRWDRLTYSSALGYALLAGGQSIGFVLGELRHQFGLSGVVAALHGSVFGVTALLIGYLGVPIVDRLGRRTSLLAAAMGITIGITTFCVGPVWPVTLAGAALAGLSGALLAIVMPGLISDHHGEHRAAAFAAVNGAVGLTAVTFSLVVGGALALNWSWRLPYLLLTALIVLMLTAVAWPVAVPESTRNSNFTLAHLRDRDVFVPWLHLLNAIFPEIAIAVWATTYLKEVGHASGGLASAFAGTFGVAMFFSRQVVPRIVRVFGDVAVSSCFIILAIGSLLMVLGGGLLPRVAGLTIVGMGAGPLYPLDVDRLYLAAEHKIDSVSLGAICILAAGVAITLGPLALGVLADSIGLRRALLIVPASCVVGAITQWRRPQPIADRGWA